MACCRRRTVWSALLGLLCLAAGLRGGEPKRLTTDGRLKFSPVFFNGGKDIVYAELEKPEQFRLKRLRLATGEVEPLHRGATTSEFEPAVSADGRSYAFLRTIGILRVAVIIRDATSGAEVEVPPGQGLSGLRGPALTPDASRLAFSFADKGQHIYSVDARGADRKTLTMGQGLNTDPCYSPDGKRIVFSSTRDGNYEIYVMDAAGGNVKRLTHSPHRDVRPRFSPDGKRIAFTSHRDGNAEIYLMNADGTGVRRLTNHPERDDYAAWHPDGKQLVIISEREGRHDLYQLQVDEVIGK